MDQHLDLKLIIKKSIPKFEIKHDSKLSHLEIVEPEFIINLDYH